MRAAAPDLDRLELRAVGLADSVLAGVAPSLRRGEGIEPDGIRPYVPGDDVRALDWCVTARTGRPHVRERAAERDLELRLLVDRSASLSHDLAPAPGEAALDVAAALAAAAHRGGLRFGVTLFDARALSEVPPGRGRAHLRRVLSALDAAPPPGRETALAPVLERAIAPLRARALVAVVSDFRFTPRARGEAGAALARAARRHDLLPVRIRAPDAARVGPVGRVRVVDPESGRETILDTSSPRVRRLLEEAAREDDAWWSRLWTSLAVAPVEVVPGEPLGPRLAGGLTARHRRHA